VELLVKYFCFLLVNDHGCLHWEYGHPDELHTIYPKKPLFKRDNTIGNQMRKWPKLPSCLISSRSAETVYYHQDINKSMSNYQSDGSCLTLTSKHKCTLRIALVKNNGGTLGYKDTKMDLFHCNILFCC
jgi:hypothetical protein